MTAPAAPARHRRRWIVVGVVATVLLAVVLLVFEPQTLFIDTRVDDAFPTSTGTVPAPTGEPAAERADDATAATDATTATPTSATTPPADPVALVTGTFVARDHPTTGTATVYELADGQRLLRLEDLATDNGPDLKVYLSTAGADAPASALDDDVVDLGPLMGNLGNQNYAIPDDVDVSRYASVVIWCKRFAVAFGTSPLVPA